MNIDVPTGMVRGATTLDLQRDARLSGFSLHPEGKSFATSVAVPRYDIWLIEGFQPPVRGLGRGFRFW